MGLTKEYRVMMEYVWELEVRIPKHQRLSYLKARNSTEIELCTLETPTLSFEGLKARGFSVQGPGPQITCWLLITINSSLVPELQYSHPFSWHSCYKNWKPGSLSLQARVFMIGNPSLSSRRPGPLNPLWSPYYFISFSGAWPTIQPSSVLEKKSWYYH